MTREELQLAETTLFKQAQFDVFCEEIACLSSKGKVYKSSSIVSLSLFLDVLIAEFGDMWAIIFWWALPMAPNHGLYSTMRMKSLEKIG